MPRQPEKQPSQFWERLQETFGEGQPLGQTEIARAFGMGQQSSVQAWYYGDRLPPLKMLEEMADRGDTTLDYLGYGRLPKRRVRRGSDLEKLLMIWGALSDDGRERLLEAAKDRLARERNHGRVAQTLTPSEIAEILRESRRL